MTRLPRGGRPLLNVAATHAFHELTGIAAFETLGRLLASFAEDWRGWKGERKWQSADNDFSLVCPHDRVRGVRVAVYLSDYVEGWKLEGIAVLLEAGRLQEVADEMHEFMASLPSNTNDP
jgi:Family of unknown function (DUF6228)